MIHLCEITIVRDDTAPDRFPYNVPVIRTLDRLAFTSDITFLVGENSSGKATLLETIACAAQLPTVGSESADTDLTLAAMRQLSQHLRWTWNWWTRALSSSSRRTRPLSWPALARPSSASTAARSARRTMTAWNT